MSTSPQGECLNNIWPNAGDVVRYKNWQNKFMEISKFINYFRPQCKPGENTNGAVYTNRWVYLTQTKGWQLVTEPPLTKGLDLTEFLTTPFQSHYPCHTQSVERAVALTSSSVKVKTGLKRQRNSALVKSVCRRQRPGRVTREKWSHWLLTFHIMCFIVIVFGEFQFCGFRIQIIFNAFEWCWWIIYMILRFNHSQLCN